jgi:hypothetical protein
MGSYKRLLGIWYRPEAQYLRRRIDLFWLKSAPQVFCTADGVKRDRNTEIKEKKVAFDTLIPV